MHLPPPLTPKNWRVVSFWTDHVSTLPDLYTAFYQMQTGFETACSKLHLMPTFEYLIKHDCIQREVADVLHVLVISGHRKTVLLAQCFALGLGQAPNYFETKRAMIWSAGLLVRTLFPSARIQVVIVRLSGLLRTVMFMRVFAITCHVSHTNSAPDRTIPLAKRLLYGRESNLVADL